MKHKRQATTIWNLPKATTEGITLEDMNYLVLLIAIEVIFNMKIIVSYYHKLADYLDSAKHSSI